jgi:hypothetical protein
MAWTVPWQEMGLIVSGDIGDLTIYTDRRGRKVPFPKSPPKDPPSPDQVRCRTAFRDAQASWASLSKAEKAALEQMTLVLSIPATGQNVYISAIMRGDAAGYRTLELQSHIQLPPLPT